MLLPYVASRDFSSIARTDQQHANSANRWRSGALLPYCLTALEVPEYINDDASLRISPTLKAGEIALGSDHL